MFANRAQGELCECCGDLEDDLVINCKYADVFDKKRERYQIRVIDDLLPDLAEARVFIKVDLASVF